MKPRKSNEDFGSLDSLLDTMTNVVGILVIVLVITQLKVSQAVKRVQSNLPEISQEQFDELESTFNIHQEQLVSAQKQIQILSQDKPKSTLTQIRASIAALKQEITKTRKDSANILAAVNLEKKLEQLSKEEKSVEAEITTAKKTLQQLILALKKTPRKKGVPPKVVRLPNPGIAPEGASPRYFICRYGKVFTVDETDLRKTFQQSLERGKNQMEYKNPKTHKPVSKKEIFYDWEKAKTYYERFTIGTREFRFKPQISGDKWNPRIHYTLEPYRHTGENRARLSSSISRYRDLIQQKLSREKVYLQFVVHPDSFDVYLKAREIAEEHQVPSGMIFQTSPRWFWSPAQFYRQETYGKTRPPPKTPPPPSKPKKVID